ncbi:MAG: hypothetical protein KDD35_07320, partial [Bdellovibrionales bacterium]|nr:hypothetical protein [Bdellovibrionales bacterium]
MKVELAKKWYVLLLSFFVFCYLIDSAQAQDSSETTETSESRSPDSALESLEDKEVGQTDVEVEELYDKFDINETKRKSAEREKEKNKKKNDEKSKVDPSTLSELSTLAPLSDIAVIQRRFLPKTKRFEASGSLMATINNPFFT